MALLGGKPVLATNSVFEKGPFCTIHRSVGKSNQSPPPKELLIFTPNVAGEYPVILFFHGTSLKNNDYSSLLEHISSHGYVIVAPQLYDCCLYGGQEEVNDAAKAVNWLRSGLHCQLPQNVQADLCKLARAAHSRGGKTAFALALGKAQTGQTPVPINFSALIGIDPVAGRFGKELEPKILTNCPPSFNLSEKAAMVIRNGLDDKLNCCTMCRFAPPGLNHEEFFKECMPPCGHYVTTDCGHMDMMNDRLTCFGLLVDCFYKMVMGCRRRDPMRRCVGGIVVAFLKEYFEGQSGDLTTNVRYPGVAPVALHPVEFNIGARNYVQS